MNKVHVILSGGVGSRLWPLSKKSNPKQYLPIFEGKTLFQLAVLKNIKICDELVVIGSSNNFDISRANLKEILKNDYIEIQESIPRNTAAAISFAAFNSKPDDLLLITPSDHIISDDKYYKEAIDKAFLLADQNYLVTIGITPTKPDTGYGYIKHKDENVISFQEKPNLEMATQFLKDGNYLWNSGIFCFKASVYLSELNRFRSDIFETSKKAFFARKNCIIPLEESKLIPSESIDYAVMEKSDKIKVVEGNFKWSDLGNFESLMENFIESGKSQYVIDSNLVITEDFNVELIGLKDMILVQKGKNILVLHKSDSQKVKNVFERLEKENPSLVN
jgi:mannose-1-phosphate guanylyltransferase